MKITARDRFGNQQTGGGAFFSLHVGGAVGVENLEFASQDLSNGEYIVQMVVKAASTAYFIRVYKEARAPCHETWIGKGGGPSRAKPAPRSLRRARLTPQVKAG